MPHVVISVISSGYFATLCIMLVLYFDNCVTSLQLISYFCVVIAWYVDRERPEYAANCHC